MNVATLLANAARPFGDRPAVFLGDVLMWTYEGLMRRSAGVAAWLVEQGAAPGQRAGLLMSNCPEYFEILFGAWFAGLVVVPINAKLHAKEVAFILSNCQADVLFATEDLLPVVAEAAAEGYRPGRLVVPGAGDYRRIVARDPLQPVQAAPDDVAWLFYTSGTTGRPKGAMLTHRNLLNMVLSFLADIDVVDQFDAGLCPAPLSHAAGLLCLAHVARGAANVIPASRGFEPSEMVDLINRFQGSSFFAAPTMVRRLVSSPAVARLKTHHIDQVFYGGAPMYLEDAKDALRQLGPCLWQAYGQGESPCTITYLPKRLHADIGDGRLDERLASVGIPRTGVAVRVVDGDGRNVPVGETGEVIVRGDVVMAGYWNNPDASRDALRDGWLHTGDIGTFDAYGFLTLKDRLKDLIISGGSNIYPREVEEVLLQHPHVVEASVIGRPHPDWGEEVVAFVVAAEGTNPTAGDLDAHCLRHVARYKRPKSYTFVASLPKSNYGKILKTELRKLHRAGVTG